MLQVRKLNFDHDHLSNIGIGTEFISVKKEG